MAGCKDIPMMILRGEDRMGEANRKSERKAKREKINVSGKNKSEWFQTMT